MCGIVHNLVVSMISKVSTFETSLQHVFLWNCRLDVIGGSYTAYLLGIFYGCEQLQSRQLHISSVGL